jgi:phospholipid/cholesterol/gamma-HCH transport system substrate-binding protein
VKRAIREHLGDFVAIIVLLVLGLAATAVIIISQGATLPSWLPFVGTERFDIKAAIASAQAVTPGQGQTVDISGIKVGEIKAVDLENGEAVITLAIEPKYASLIRSDASILLRPRTGLQDMTVELDPGRPSKPAIKEGATIPEANSLTQVQSDQILASLDADTRGFVQLLLADAAQGLNGNTRKLSAVFRRLDPLAQDLAKLNGALAKRQENLRHVIHDFGLVSQELANHDRQLADFVTSSNSVFAAFARQEASLQQTIAELPGTLSTTRGALASGNRLALTLRPALTRLLPQARAFGPALKATRPFFRNTTGPIRDQIRPFTHQVQPVVRHLGQGSAPLAKSANGLRGGFANLNQLLNGLAYNPAGPQEGFLFWLSWLNHNSNSALSIQDANGPLTRGLVVLSCSTAQLAENVTLTRPQLNTIRQLTNTPTSALIGTKGGCS